MFKILNIIYKVFVIVIAAIIIIGCENKNQVLKGTWIAPPEDQNIHKYFDGEIQGGKETYYLECDNNGYYDLKTKNEDLANSRYSISKNKVIFYDEGNQILAKCNLVNNKVLDCSEKSYYAKKYKKRLSNN